MALIVMLREVSNTLLAMTERKRENVFGTITSHEFKFKLGNRLVTVEYTSDSPWGRFGGGWEWKVGVQFSNLKHIIFSLLFFTVTIKKAERSGR